MDVELCQNFLTYALIKSWKMDAIQQKLHEHQSVRKKKKSENELQITANELNKVVSCMV